MKKRLLILMLVLCALFTYSCKKENVNPNPNPLPEPTPPPHTHTWNDGALDNGIMTYSCTGCSETKTENKTALYKQTFANITTAMQTLAPASQPTAYNPQLGCYAPSYVLTADSEELYVAAPETQYIQVKGVAVFVDMLTDMIENPSFRITSAPVNFTYSYARVNETGSATLMYEIDEKNDKVKMYWNVDSTQGSYTLDIFLYIGVDYNFETGTVIAFEVYTEQTRTASQGQEPIKNLICWIYDNEVLKMPNPNISDKSYVQNACDQHAAVLSAKASSVIELNADFTTEYTAAMEKMNG